METEKAFEELKNILIDTVSGIEKQKRTTKNLHIISLALGVLISISIIVSWVASPIIQINVMNNRIKMMEYFMRKFHPETKEVIPNPFVTRGANMIETTEVIQYERPKNVDE